MTEKLYWTSPELVTFETRGFTAATFQDRPSVVLDRTLFYPEGGGQLGDAGTLVIDGAAHAIVDTQIADDGTIHHLVGEALTSRADARIEGTIEASRRRDHTAQHTAQHALSRALVDVARADTVSSRLGATSCTIDVARPGIPDSELHRAEDLVNGLIASDVRVRALHPSAEELAKMPLRRAPKVTDGVRVIDIEGFDLTPCGGTHCARTGQIGQVRIVGVEKYKGMLRITFHAGLRALADARAKHVALTALAADLTCGVGDVGVAVAKLRADLKASRHDLEAARSELAELVAAQALARLPEGPGPHIVKLTRSEDVGALRVLANKLTADPRVVALVGGTTPDGDLAIVVQRGKDAAFDCGAFLAKETKARGGRGGGRPERAEGRLPRGTALDDLI